jgi:predicted secreted protein
MATVKGQNLRIFLGNAETTPIAAALQCVLQVQTNVQERSTKDDEGGWARNFAVSTSWNVKVNGAVTLDPDRNDPASLMSRIGQTVYVRMALASGEQNSTMGTMLVCGYAILSDVQITAENRRRGTYDVTLTGCKNLINEVRRLKTSNGNYLKTASGHILAAPHEA